VSKNIFGVGNKKYQRGKFKGSQKESTAKTVPQIPKGDCADKVKIKRAIQGKANNS
jgi:hypothetical protein